MASIQRSIRLDGRNSADLDRITGAKGEIFFDRTNNRLRLYDGIVPGGYALGSQEQIEDTVAAMFNGSQNGVTVNYNDTTGKVTLTVASGAPTATVITLTNSQQNYYLPNPDQVSVPVGTIYELAVKSLFGALDTERDINIQLENTITYPAYFSGTNIKNNSNTGAQIQTVTPDDTFQWPMSVGTPNTTGIVSGTAKIIYCGVGTWSISGTDYTGHMYTVFATTDLTVFGG